MSQQINLYSPVFLEQRKIFSARLLGAALAAVTVTLAGIHVTQRVQLALARQQLEEANGQFARAKDDLVRYSTERQRPPSRLLADEASRLEARLRAQTALVERFDSGALGNTDGFSRYLAALARQTLQGVWVTGFVASGAEGVRTIRGHLATPDLLPQYLRMLHREEAMRGQGFNEFRLTGDAVNPAATRPAGASAAVEFTLGPMPGARGTKP